MILNSLSARVAKPAALAGETARSARGGLRLSLLARGGGLGISTVRRRDWTQARA